MFWRENATMTNDKMDKNRSALWWPGFKCKWILQATVGEKRQAKVEPTIRIFHEIRAGNPAARQHHAKDL
jgi:hypothetical protein